MRGPTDPAAPFSVSCQALRPEDLTAFTTFVETEAFSDNPSWADCYCVFAYRQTNTQPDADGDFDPRAAEQNRATLFRLVKEGRGHWILARHEGRLVGWVNADLLSRMPRYEDWGPLLAGETGVISCFVVHPRLRRRGIARHLLNAAVAALRTMGASQVESWVVRDPKAAAKPPLGPDQVAYRGPLAMYLRAGFSVVAEKDGVVRVRRTLPPPA